MHEIKLKTGITVTSAIVEFDTYKNGGARITLKAQIFPTTRYLKAPMEMAISFEAIAPLVDQFREILEKEAGLSLEK